MAKFDDDWEWVQSEDPQELSDWKSLGAAKAALNAWAALPLSRRDDPRDPGAQALFDAAFGLLGADRAKLELAQHGADEALSRDDDRALAGFIALGAAFPAIEAPQGEPDHQAYGDAWQSSVAHYCALRGHHKCLRLFLDSGLISRDAAVADALLREPEPSPLRQIDKALLAQAAGPHAGGELQDSGDELVLGLIGAMAEQSESLSSSIAVAEALRGHPLFRLLAGEIERDRFGRQSAISPNSPVSTLARDMAAQGLFKPHLASHRGAALSLAAQGSPGACEILIDAGLDASHGARAQKEAFEKLLCNPQGIEGLAPGARALCAAWAAQPGFGQELFDKTCRAAQRSLQEHLKNPSDKGANDQWRASRRLRRLDALIRAASHPSRGFEAPSQDALAQAQAWVDGVLLENNAPKGSDALGALRSLGETLGGLRLPKRPTLRV